MSDNMKEDSSLKINSDNELELYGREKGKEKKKEESCKYSLCEIIITINFIIILICFFLYISFENKISLFQKKDPSENEKKDTEIQQTKNSIRRDSKEKETQNEKTAEICKEGFYIPTDDKKKKCQKCSLENCSKCSGDKKNNVCLSCIASYTPIYDKHKKIKKCTKVCETGENEKCNKCDKNECVSCNIGYKLIKGNCIANYSFDAVYQTYHKNEKILLINKKYRDDIIELIIDNNKVKPSYNYTFPNKGKHNIKVLLNNDNLISGKMMFYNITNLIRINFTSEFRSTNMVNMRGMFKDCIKLKSVDLSNLNTNNVSDFSFMFDNCSSLNSINLSHFETKKARDISYMFSNCLKLSKISLKSFDTNNVIDMTGLFYGSSSLSSIDLTNLNTQNTQYMLYMFSKCSSLNSIDISSFETKKVKDISYMFEDCKSIKSIDLSKMNTHSITNMDGLFKGCSLLPLIDLSTFETKNVRSANKMFYGCKNLKKLDISSFKNITWNIRDELFNENVSKTGEIKITKNFYNKTKNNIPQKWKIIKVK